LVPCDSFREIFSDIRLPSTSHHTIPFYSFLNRKPDYNPPPQIYFKNQLPPPGGAHPKHLPLHDVLSLVIDSFTGATERHIEVGDGLEIYIVLAAHRSSAELEALPGIERVQGSFLVLGEQADAGREGEKIFVMRRELKKD